MADFVPVPNAAALTLFFRSNAGKVFTNGFGFVKGSTWGTTDLQNLCDAVPDAFEELISPVMSEEVVLWQITARDLSTEEGNYAENVPASPIAGEDAFPLGLLNAALIVTFRTGIIGRSARGRMYFGGVAAAARVNDQLWSESKALQVQNAFGSFLPTIATETESEHCVISRQEDNVPLTTGITRVVTNYIGRTYVGTVRGRVRP